MVFWFISFLVFAGVSVDTANGWRHRAVLQATADAAVLAAAFDLPDTVAARQAAIAVAETNMPAASHGQVLPEAAVEFGHWDVDARLFTAGGAPVDAVRATVSRTTAQGNPLPTYMLRLIGFFEWNVDARAVAQRYIPECLNDGIFARGMVSISSNNDFSGDICVHGQHHVEVQSNNFWETSVSVSMPNLADFEIPTGGWASNTNIADILVEEWFDPKLVDEIDNIVAAILAHDPAWLPEYIDPLAPVINVSGEKNFNPAALIPGRIYNIDCTGPNKNITMGNAAVVSKVVLIADCKFTLGNGSFYDDVVIAATNGNPDAPQEALITVSQNTTLGADDNCSTGGGVVLLSKAGIHGASGTRYHGVQVIASGDVSLAAAQEAVEGLQAQVGGDFSFTSNNVIGTCSGGVDGYEVAYHRLVQ